MLSQLAKPMLGPLSFESFCYYFYCWLLKILLWHSVKWCRNWGSSPGSSLLQQLVCQVCYNVCLLFMLFAMSVHCGSHFLLASGCFQTCSNSRTSCCCVFVSRWNPWRLCNQGHCLMRLTILDLLQSLRTMARELSGSWSQQLVWCATIQHRRQHKRFLLSGKCISTLPRRTPSLCECCVGKEYQSILFLADADYSITALEFITCTQSLSAARLVAFEQPILSDPGTSERTNCQIIL